MPEVRRLLLALAGPPALRAHRWAWSVFRRRHQATAKRCHTARRTQVGHPTTAPPVQTVAPGPPTLTETRWARIAPLLPPEPGTGRPARDHRTVLAGILWVIQRGAAWNELPTEFGPWQTANRRYRRWRQDGTWDRILAEFVTDVS